MLKHITTILLFSVIQFNMSGVSLNSCLHTASIVQTDESIELTFDKEGKLSVKTSNSMILLVRLFNRDGRKIIVKPEEQSKEVKLKDKLPAGSSWYVQIKTSDGNSSLRKITVP